MFYFRFICFLFLLVALGCGDSTPSSAKVKVVPTIESQNDLGNTKTASNEEMVQIESPHYLRWAKHKVGTTVVFSEKSVAPTYTTETTTTYKLKSVSDDKVVVEISGDILTPDGKKHSSNSQEITHSRYVKIPSKKDKKEFARPTGTFEERDDKITVLDKEYPAKWYKSKGHVEAGETISETWIVEALPGGMAKSIFSIPTIKKMVTSEIVRISTE
jgi:hypothetical protein